MFKQIPMELSPSGNRRTHKIRALRSGHLDAAAAAVVSISMFRASGGGIR